MSDFETHPAGTAARIAELESANGVHIFRALSKQEMVEVEKMAADGKFQEAAQKFGGQVTYHQDQRDLPPMTDAELALHLRGRLVPMSVAYRAASRIEQLVATVEQLEAELTRANAATALVVEQLTADVTFAETDAAFSSITIGKTSAPFNDQPLYIAQLVKHVISSRKRLATPDQTAALDRLIAEAVGPLINAADAMLAAFCVHENSAQIAAYAGMMNTILAASKKGGV